MDFICFDGCEDSTMAQTIHPLLQFHSILISLIRFKWYIDQMIEKCLAVDTTRQSLNVSDTVFTIYFVRLLIFSLFVNFTKTYLQTSTAAYIPHNNVVVYPQYSVGTGGYTNPSTI